MSIDPFARNAADDNDTANGFNNWKLKSDSQTYYFNPSLAGFHWRAMNPVSGNASERVPMFVTIDEGANQKDYTTLPSALLDDFAVNPTDPATGGNAWTRRNS